MAKRIFPVVAFHPVGVPMRGVLRILFPCAGGEVSRALALLSDGASRLVRSIFA